MIKTGDMIKMVKAIPGFDKVGDQFKVTGVSGNGYITIECGYGTGVMSFDEMTTHFEAVPPKRAWSVWKYTKDNVFGIVWYRTNGKKVEAILENYGKCKGYASCHPDDKFDENIGVGIAAARAYLKYQLTKPSLAQVIAKEGVR